VMVTLKLKVMKNTRFTPFLSEAREAIRWH
jgi:hypothetical protein